MAKLSALTVVALFCLVGCQAAQPVSMVDNLPSPNYAGPAMPELKAIPAPQPAPAPAVAQAPSRSLRSDGLSRGIPRDWTPVAAPNQWRWIVIHHSATPTGGAAAFDKMHRAKGWDELGYHFVVGNGTDTRDGQIEVGSRWPKQKWGAHAKTPDNRFNEYGIGICLVGNFDVGYPSAAQMASVDRLVAYLMKTYHIPADHVLGHGDTKATDCPGRHMSVATVRRNCVRMLADAGEQVPQDTRTASAELLVDERKPAVK